MPTNDSSLTDFDRKDLALITAKAHFATLALVISSVLLVAGCGNDNKAQETTETETTAAETTATDAKIKPFAMNLKNAQEGEVPKGANVFSGTWAVRKEEGAPNGSLALCQTEDTEFAAIELDEQNYIDFTASTDFKPISGTVDQAGGIIFHVKDSDNYYIVRANALEDNIAFYIYENGDRSQIGPDGNVEVKKGEWQTLGLKTSGESFSASLNGKKVLEVSDSTFASGGTGLWTKADSTTCFGKFSTDL